MKINRAAVERTRRMYKPGQRVKLLSMDDFQAPPKGTKGTVIGVDDIGSVMVAWDNGSSLNLVPEAGDSVEFIYERKG